MRDIEKYASDYQSSPFEKKRVEIRRRKVLEIMRGGCQIKHREKIDAV
jgi:hypothetical protein